MKPSQIFNNVKQFCEKNSNSLMAAGAVIMLGATVYTTIKATPKVHDILEEKNEEGASTKDKVKAVIPPLIPPVVCTLTTAGLIICGNMAAVKKIDSLSGAVALSNMALKEYQEKTKEVVGEKKEQKIRDDIQQDHVSSKPLPTTMPTTQPLPGQLWCWDPFRRDYFFGEAEDIRRKVNDLSNGMGYGRWGNDYVSVSDWLIATEQPDISYSDDYRWYAEDGPIEVYFTSFVHPQNNQPVLVVNFYTKPKHYLEKGYSN